MKTSKISSSSGTKQKQNLVTCISNLYLLGFAFSGKSSLVRNFIKSSQSLNSITTSSIYETDIPKSCQDKIQDMGLCKHLITKNGCSSQKEMRMSSMKITVINKAAIILFDITNKQNFEYLHNVIAQWSQTVEHKQKKNCIIVGTKRDREEFNERQVQFDEGLQKAKQLKTIYIETSDRQNNDMIFFKAFIFQQSRQNQGQEVVKNYIEGLKKDIENSKLMLKGFKDDTQISEIRYLWESTFCQSYFQIKAKGKITTQKMKQAIALSLKFYKALKLNLYEIQNLKEQGQQIKAVAQILEEGNVCPQAESIVLRNQLDKIYLAIMMRLENHLKQSEESMNYYLINLQKLSNINSPFLKEVHKKQNYLGILKEFIQRLQRNININMGKQKINKQQTKIFQYNQNDKPTAIKSNKSRISVQSVTQFHSYSITSVQFCLSSQNYNKQQMFDLLKILRAQQYNLQCIVQSFYRLQQILKQIMDQLNILKVKIYENRVRKSISQVQVINLLLRLYISSTQNQFLVEASQQKRVRQVQKQRLQRRIQLFSQPYLDKLQKIAADQSQKVEDIQKNILDDLFHRRRLKLLINQLQVLEYWVQVGKGQRKKREEQQKLLQRIARFFRG